MESWLAAPDGKLTTLGVMLLLGVGGILFGAINTYVELRYPKSVEMAKIIVGALSALVVCTIFFPITLAVLASGFVKHWTPKEEEHKKDPTH